MDDEIWCETLYDECVEEEADGDDSCWGVYERLCVDEEEWDEDEWGEDDG